MIARIAEIDRLPPDLDEEYLRRHREHLASLDGFCGGYHLLEPASGHALSITLWRDEDALAAGGRALAAPSAPADGRITRQSNSTVRIVDVVAVL
jgi:heme-degrading monooxygenase HmoA